VRQGSTFTGYASADGASWVQVGTATIGMADPIYVGLPVTAHNNAALSTATLDHVAVSAPPVPTATASTTPVAPTNTPANTPTGTPVGAATATSTPAPPTSTAAPTNTPANTATPIASLAQGVVGYWPFDEGSGSTTADVSGNGNTGTLLGGTSWTAGRFGSALSFNGSTAYVSAGIHGMPAANAPQSISWWMNFSSIPTTIQTVICLCNDAHKSAVQPGFRNGQVGVWKSGGTFLVSAAPPSANTWHHYAYTCDGTTHRLYIDGTLLASSTVVPQTAAVANLQFGHWTGGQEYFSGQLDDVRIYTRALSATEVQALAQQP
jgi:Concanavalin A-like lectin/glucanases superfamily